MAALVRYKSFKSLKKHDKPKNSTGAGSPDQVKELEVFFKQLNKKKGSSKEKK